MTVRAIRGAIQVDADDRDAILERPGTTRDLTTREIGELYAAVGL